MEAVNNKPVVVRRYYNSNMEVLLDCYSTFDRKVTLYGPNQLHQEVVTLLPCGNPPKTLAGETDYHEDVFHNEVCDGKEHVTTCIVAKRPYLKTWGTCCNLQCRVFLLKIKEDVQICFEDCEEVTVNKNPKFEVEDCEEVTVNKKPKFELRLPSGFLQ